MSANKSKPKYFMRKTLKHRGTGDTKVEKEWMFLTKKILQTNSRFFNIGLVPIGFLLFLCVPRASVFQTFLAFRIELPKSG